jgi:bifunctional non-homologous end joining protein LigD
VCSAHRSRCGTKTHFVYRSGFAVFERLRRKHEARAAFLYAYDLLELDGVDLRREPIETRKATLASLLRGSLPGLRVNEH